MILKKFDSFKSTLTVACMQNIETPSYPGIQLFVVMAMVGARVIGDTKHQSKKT